MCVRSLSQTPNLDLAVLDQLGGYILAIIVNYYILYDHKSMALKLEHV